MVQSTGHDPGMEIVRRIWPGDEPFATPRAMLMKEIDRQLNGEGGQYHFENHDDAASLFLRWGVNSELVEPYVAGLTKSPMDSVVPGERHWETIYLLER